MRGRNVVRISRLKGGPPSGDWVTIGVVATASSKVSSKGGAYCIWRVTDLNGSNILVFLFGEAYQKFWGEFAGVVVALLNPAPSENKDRKDDGTPAYSVRHEGQLLKLGKSKDFGICKSLRLDGQPCQNVSTMGAGRSAEEEKEDQPLARQCACRWLCREHVLSRVSVCSKRARACTRSRTLDWCAGQWKRIVPILLGTYNT